MLLSVRRSPKVFVALLTAISVTFYYFYMKKDFIQREIKSTELTKSNNYLNFEDYHVWLIFTKVYVGSPLTYKFEALLGNLMETARIPLKFNIIIDSSSEVIAKNIFSKQMKKFKKSIPYTLFNITSSAQIIEDIIEVMSNFFSKPGSYYNDVLFYISLGLHRIAPLDQKYAILLDCDIHFERDIALVFDQFRSFKETALFGIAPELSPVYRHVMRSYRIKHPNTTVGDWYHWNKTVVPDVVHSRGFQGYNSGVLLLKLDSIRNSKEYRSILNKSALGELTKKYHFKQGHLGDQDFYTLLGCEYPHLIQTIHCGFNRQLCTWWRDNGYKDVFHHYARCDHEVVILHGNCNTHIPR